MIIKLKFKSRVKKFSGNMAWYYLEVPNKILPENLPTINRWQFTKINATIGKTSWKTSLLPLKNGKKFIAIKAEIRKKESIEINSEVEIQFEIDC